MPQAPAEGLRVDPKEDASVTRIVADVENIMVVVRAPPRARCHRKQVADFGIVEPDPGISSAAAAEICQNHLASASIARSLVDQFDSDYVHLIRRYARIELIKS
ncbi:hypothetical protein J2W18_003954 [Rhodococcus cercidiphylli]|nr:hypothetical protein [Rhodococcus cercidiphylli]